MNLVITSLLFFPEKDFSAQPREAGLREQEVSIPVREGVILHGWFFQAEAPKATLLFFHGNAGNISGRLFKAKAWLEYGISVFLVDYRGYGKSSGGIRRAQDLIEDAQAALGWLEGEQKTPSDQVILYGESIGSYPAIELARQKRFAGLVLEAPFSTLFDLARTHYPWAPAFLLKDFPMNNEEAIAGVQAPVFILHGDQDEICPIGMGERLYERAPSPKEFFGVSGGGHNDLPEAAGTGYVKSPYEFLARKNRFV